MSKGGMPSEERYIRQQMMSLRKEFAGLGFYLHRENKRFGATGKYIRCYFDTFEQIREFLLSQKEAQSR